MSHKGAIEAFDRTLKDLWNSKKIMGGESEAQFSKILLDTGEGKLKGTDGTLGILRKN